MVRRESGGQKEPVERKIIRKPKVRELTGYSDTTIWRLEKQGRFPKRVRLGEMSVGWYADEVCEWVRLRLRGMGRQPPLPRRSGERQAPKECGSKRAELNVSETRAKHR